MDIKDLILSQLPEGAIGDLAQKAGVGEDVIGKIMDAGSDEITKNGLKTEGGLFENIEKEVVGGAIAEKTGLDKDMVSKVLDVALPFMKERIDGDELKKIIGGLSDGFGMDDIQNIAGAVFDENNKEKSGSKSGGFLGNILGGLFGKK
jgi:uncharacterized protein YidB (DUF937 family)